MKLVINAAEKSTTYVESMEVKHWDELRMFHVKPLPGFHSEEIEEFISNLNQAYNNSDFKPVILFGDNFEIEVYIIEEEKLGQIAGQMEIDFGGSY